MNEKTRSIVDFIQDTILCDHASWDLREVINRLPEKPEEAAGLFCDCFELGNWFYEAITLGDVDINKILIDIAEEKRLQEKEAAADRAEIEQGYRQSQGWHA